MGQSKKTFRLRKSRRSHVEAVQVKSEQSNNISQPQTSQPSILTPPTPVMEPSSFSIPSDSSSIRSRRSSSIRQSDCEKGGNLLNDQQLHATLHYHHHHHHHHHHHLHLQTSDASWDEDTSTPPLASPDLNDMPSTSSTTTHVFEGSSPDCSINGSGGEKTALLTASQRTTSQHSLLMVFPNQDEDTLI
ncbi:nuclear receptor subfamily 4 group A member 3 isoform X2 [Apis florea]|uniref:nuclear receptor subfamily 4 group A member 3 isoform X2 n=1 Tax=Apis florea TaxID=7463 RepID=UPI00062929A5|nr:nuclear receptor subfamily 4 group A member 3 isoform X2 [Apis florea]